MHGLLELNLKTTLFAELRYSLVLACNEVMFITSSKR